MQSIRICIHGFSGCALCDCSGYRSKNKLGYKQMDYYTLHSDKSKKSYIATIYMLFFISETIKRPQFKKLYYRS